MWQKFGCSDVLLVDCPHYVVVFCFTRVLFQVIIVLRCVTLQPRPPIGSRKTWEAEGNCVRWVINLNLNKGYHAKNLCRGALLSLFAVSEGPLLKVPLHVGLILGRLSRRGGQQPIMFCNTIRSRFLKLPVVRRPS